MCVIVPFALAVMITHVLTYVLRHCTYNTPENLITGMLVVNDISLYLWEWDDLCYYKCTGGASPHNSIPKIRCSVIPTRVSLVLSEYLST